MTRMRIIVATAVLVFSGSAASACSCIPRSEAEQIARNNVIVQGSVVSVRHGSRLGRRTVVARIHVQTANERMSRRYINVEAYEQIGQCAVIFKPNEKIRFAAVRRGLAYRTNICKIFPVRT